MSPARRQVLVSIILPILFSLAISAFAAYVDNDKALSSRVSVIEAKQGDDRRQLGEIKATVDKIYDKVAGW